MPEPALHVTAETRTVYRSARGWKLQRHAAYVGAAKHLIAKACRRDGEKREAAWLESCDDHGNFDLSQPAACGRDTGYQCRFHTYTEPTPVYLGDGEWDEQGGGMLYYAKVLPRLVRFLKFVDARRGERERRAG